MFSTLFYIFILLFEGLFSSSSEDYNLQIALLNQQINSRDYGAALKNAKQLKRSSIYINPAIENAIAIIELKIHASSPLAKSVTLNSHSI